jgi:hypothetical protein
MKMLLEEFSAQVDISKPKIGNENMEEISKDNRVGLINFVTSKIFSAKRVK